MRRRTSVPGGDGSQSESLAFERLVFFSDAVFAIAITLLVIDLRLPDGASIGGSRDLLQALGSLAPRLVGMVVSFVVIGSLWVSHHRFFRLVQSFDTGLLVLNLVFLLFVASLPFPTAVVGRHSVIPEAEALYAAWVAAAGLAKLGMWLHASRRGRLLVPGLGGREIALTTLGFAMPGAVFMVSVPLAWVHWIAPILAWNLAPLGYLAGRSLVGRPGPRAGAAAVARPRSAAPARPGQAARTVRPSGGSAARRAV